jgi:hypothetical protein
MSLRFCYTISNAQQYELDSIKKGQMYVLFMNAYVYMQDTLFILSIRSFTILLILEEAVATSSWQVTSSSLLILSKVFSIVSTCKFKTACKESMLVLFNNLLSAATLDETNTF